MICTAVRKTTFVKRNKGVNVESEEADIHSSCDDRTVHTTVYKFNKEQFG